MELLTFGNAKTIKGMAKGYRTAILHFAPHTVANITLPSGELFNACPSAGKCIKPCLNLSGHGNRPVVKSARAFRTEFFVKHREAFFFLLEKELTQALDRAKADNLKLAFRPNGTSDLPVIGKWAATKFPELIVYDYTKIPQPWKRTMSNYHLTFSWEGSNWRSCQDFLKRGGNVAVPFYQAIPESFKGYPVISGDEDDLRFLDPGGVIVGLTAKGVGKVDHSGFVVRLDE